MFPNDYFARSKDRARATIFGERIGMTLISGTKLGEKLIFGASFGGAIFGNGFGAFLFLVFCAPLPKIRSNSIERDRTAIVLLCYL